MASRVEFAVSCTPIYTHSNAEGVSVDVLASDVGKTLGGSGSVTCTWGSTIGYPDGGPELVSATTATSLGTFTNIKFAHIKHTGFSDTSLVVPSTAVLTLLVGGVIFAKLNPGQAVILPFAAATSPVFTATSSSGTVQVEVMATA